MFWFTTTKKTKLLKLINWHIISLRWKLDKLYTDWGPMIVKFVHLFAFYSGGRLVEVGVDLNLSAGPNEKGVLIYI